MYQLFPESGNLGLVLPPALASWTLDKVKKGQLASLPAPLINRMIALTAEGVEVFPNVTPVSVEPESGGVKVTTSSGIEVNICSRSCDYHMTPVLLFLQLTVDHVVVAVGLWPNTDLASSGQLEVDRHLGGFRVNAELQACSNVWAVSLQWQRPALSLSIHLYSRIY